MVTKGADVEQDPDAQLKEMLKVFIPLVEKLGPLIIEYQKITEPRVKRAQIINSVIMITLILAIAILAYLKLIDGSAATGLFGAIIGYVFGGLYNQNKGK